MTWNIIGHNSITDLLESAIKNDKLSHAYLFYGPKSIGKKTLVKKFIENLMCYDDDKNKKEIPCEKCNACSQIQKNLHSDITWLKKEKDKKDITVEQIRQLEEKLSVSSFFKSYKIAIIENAEQMNLASANALLKTLEEPTKKTIIILITSQISKIPKTILSRTQKIKLLSVPNKIIYDHLISQKIDHSHSLELANLSFGRPGRALIFSYAPELWQSYLNQVDLFFKLISANRVSRFKFAEKFLSSKENLIEKNAILIPTLNLWQLLLRDQMLYNLNQDDKIINLVAKNNFNKLNNHYSPEKLISLQKNISLIKKYLKLNINPRLAFENLLLKF